jgi:hypothetical protein
MEFKGSSQFFRATVLQVKVRTKYRGLIPAGDSLRLGRNARNSHLSEILRSVLSFLAKVTLGKLGAS